jgi:mRNA interferase MazF
VKKVERLKWNAETKRREKSFVEMPEQGDVIMLQFSPSEGSEIKRMHPALVVSNNLVGDTSSFVWVVPISHGDFSMFKDYPLHIELGKSLSKIEGNLYLEQMKSIDFVSRQWQYKETAPNDLLQEVLGKMRVMMT